MNKKKAFSLFTKGGGGSMTKDQLERMIKIFGKDYNDQGISDIMKVVLI